MEGMVGLQEWDWEENLISTIRRNICFILETFYEDSQTSMAKSLNIRTNTLHTYINTDTKPPITFIYKLCKEHNLSVDAFLNNDLAGEVEKARKKETIKTFCKKYIGCYHTYFFVIDSNSLMEGLIQEGILEIDDFGSIKFQILNSDKYFSGTMTASDELIYLDLRSIKEKINIVLKNPGKNIKERYIGGMGILNISSPEDNRIPAAQKLIISRVKIPIKEYFNTLTEFLEVKTFLKIRKDILEELLITTMAISDDKQQMLGGLLKDSRISGKDRLIIDENRIALLNRVLGKEEFTMFLAYLQKYKNCGDIIKFNSMKIGIEEDKMIYRFIKNEFKLKL